MRVDMPKCSSSSEGSESTSTSNGSDSSRDGSSSTSNSTSTEINDSKIDAHFSSGLPLDGKFHKPLDQTTSEPKASGLTPSELTLSEVKPRNIKTVESTPSTLTWGKMRRLLATPQSKKVLLHVPEPTDSIHLAPLDSTGFYSKL